MSRWAFSTHVGPFAFTRLPTPKQSGPSLFLGVLWLLLQVMFWAVKVTVVAVVILVAMVAQWVTARRDADHG